MNYRGSLLTLGDVPAHTGNQRKSLILFSFSFNGS